MKYLFILTVFLNLSAFPQQKPHYTQYITNQYIINPALTGIENYIDVKLSHRHQWTGIDGAPVTSYFTIQGPIGKKDYRTSATSLKIPGQNPRGKQYWEDYTAAEPHHGIGLQVINDVTGPLSNTSVYGTYAYHLGLTAKTSISAGFGAGVSRYSINASRLVFANTSVDPVVYSSNTINTARLDMNAGIYLYSPDYFAGISVQQILPSKLDFSDNTIAEKSGRTIPHIFFTSGYRILIDEDFNFTPSIMIKYIRPLKVQTELNLKLQYQDLLWIAAGYRYKDGFAGMLGLNVSNTFNLSYSYDYTTSVLNNYSKGSHEFVFGFIIGNKYSDMCPKNVW